MINRLWKFGFRCGNLFSANSIPLPGATIQPPAAAPPPPRPAGAGPAQQHPSPPRRRRAPRPRLSPRCRHEFFSGTYAQGCVGGRLT